MHNITIVMIMKSFIHVTIIWHYPQKANLHNVIMNITSILIYHVSSLQSAAVLINMFESQNRIDLNFKRMQQQKANQEKSRHITINEK